MAADVSRTIDNLDYAQNSLISFIVACRPILFLIRDCLFCCVSRVLLVSRVSSGATVHSRKSPAHTAEEKKASEATIYSQKVLINASESVYM